jgi:hypothetical protein
MAKRPDGLAALTAAFRDYDLDERRLRAFTQPVYYALGGRSNPDAYARPAQRLAGLFLISPWRPTPSATTSIRRTASNPMQSREPLGSCGHGERRDPISPRKPEDRDALRTIGRGPLCLPSVAQFNGPLADHRGLES